MGLRDISSNFLIILAYLSALAGLLAGIGLVGWFVTFVGTLLLGGTPLLDKPGPLVLLVTLVGGFLGYSALGITSLTLAPVPSEPITIAIYTSATTGIRVCGNCGNQLSADVGAGGQCPTCQIWLGEEEKMSGPS